MNRPRASIRTCVTEASRQEVDPQMFHGATQIAVALRWHCRYALMRIRSDPPIDSMLGSDRGIPMVD